MNTETIITIFAIVAALGLVAVVIVHKKLRPEDAEIVLQLMQVKDAVSIHNLLFSIV